MKISKIVSSCFTVQMDWTMRRDKNNNLSRCETNFFQSTKFQADLFTIYGLFKMLHRSEWIPNFLLIFYQFESFASSRSATSKSFLKKKMRQRDEAGCLQAENPFGGTRILISREREIKMMPRASLSPAI